MLERLTIAIDGPVASGKSAVGKAVARRLGFRFLDTGLMYRAVGYAALTNGIEPGDKKELARLARSLRIVMSSTGDGARVLVDEEDINVSEFFSEPDRGAVLDGIDELVGEFFTRDVETVRIRMETHRLVTDGLQEMGLAEAHGTADEEGIVGLGGLARDGQ